MLNHFTYLLETSYWLLQHSTVGDKYPFAKKYELVNEINQIGTRYSGKTISNIKMFGELLKISLLIKEPICIIVSMYWSKDLKDSVFQNIWNMLDENNISYTINLSNFTFTLSNGSKIYCKGLHSPSRKEKLKAFADLNKYKLVIDWREECDQFQQKDLSDLEFAIRGYQNKITINTCNPESLKRYIVDYCNELLPFNEEIMRSKYEQINYIEKWNMKIIIHYSSWRLNYELPQDKVNEQLRLEQLDIERARVWSWGLPGNTSGSIFVRYIDIMQATDIIQPTKLLGGVDLANSTSPKGHTTAASFWIYNSFDKKAYFVQSSSSTVDGQLSQSLQVVQGTPTLETYTEDQKAIIEQVYLACHFSSPFGDKSDNDQNKTQSLLAKTKDLEKQAYLQAYRKQYYTKMFDTVLKYYGLWDGNGERPYGFDFISASLVDQMRQNELITARLDNGTMEPIRAITEYDNVDELEATKYYEKIEAWQDKMQAKEIEHNNKLLEYDETGNNQNAVQGRTEIKEN